MGTDDSPKNTTLLDSVDAVEIELQTTVTRSMGTQVDLGDDLLATRIVSAPSSHIPKAPASVPVESHASVFSSHSPEDQFESARILIREGLIEDAKKLLRHILISDSHHAPARRALKEILDKEMKELLDGSSPVRRPRIFERKGKESRTPQATEDQVLRELDRDFGLGIFESDSERAIAPSFQAEMSGVGCMDRIDLGIAFLEMGLHQKAIALFRSVSESLDVSQEDDRLLLISSTALLARTHLELNHAFDATLVLHPLLKNIDLSTHEKIEIFYLMGRAQEALGNRKEALTWYLKVQELDSAYRDLTERLRQPLR